MDKDINLDSLLGISNAKKSRMEKVKTSLVQQKQALEQEIYHLQGQLDNKKEYLAKLEGGLDVIEELTK
jgi:hypothetical protein